MPPEERAVASFGLIVITVSAPACAAGDAGPAPDLPWYGMFEGFTAFDVPVRPAFATEPVTIHGVRGGEGPPLLLLHGFPETRVMWAPIASRLAQTHTVIAPDLRGYGDSSVPPASEDHAGASFRAMAADQVALLQELGFDRARVVGHDRGARVAHRLALDSPERVERLALLDILPTLYVFEHLDQRVATAYYHWFFLAQPAPLPERLIAADPTFYLHRLLGAWGRGGPTASHAAAIPEYERCFADPDRRRAMIEDYRASASIDLAHDRESAARGEHIAVPTLLLWGATGVVGRYPTSPLEVWRQEVGEGVPIAGQAIEGAGHFMVEDEPEPTRAELEPFLLSPTA
ncbi:MAG: alpha/beta fold hydrolase [Candidatus Dormibacteraceae bacterium]